MQEYDFDSIFSDMAKCTHKGKKQESKAETNKNELTTVKETPLIKVEAPKNNAGSKPEVSFGTLFMKLILAAAIVVGCIYFVDANDESITNYSKSYTETLSNGDIYTEKYFVSDGKLSAKSVYLNNKMINYEQY